MLKRATSAQEKTIALYDSNVPGLAVMLDVGTYPLIRFSVTDMGVRFSVRAAKKHLPRLLDVAFALADNFKADPGLVERVLSDEKCLYCETPDCDMCGRVLPMIDQATIGQACQTTSLIVTINFDDGDDELLDRSLRDKAFTAARDRATKYFDENVENAVSWTYWGTKRIGSRKYRVQWRRPLRKKG